LEFDIDKYGKGERPVRLRPPHHPLTHNPVAYFKEGKPLMGKKEFSFQWNGAQWSFSSVYEFLWVYLQNLGNFKKPVK